MTGFVYRVIVTGAPCGAVTSAPAVLTTNPLPTVVVVADPISTLTPSTSSSLKATANPAGTFLYQWFRNGALVPGMTGSVLPINVDGFGNYSVTVTDSKGCTANSSLVTVSDAESGKLFVYPNPSSGQFQVRYFSSSTVSIDRTLSVYDSKGARVYSKAYSIGNPYERMDVNLANAQAGLYMVELIDAQGNRLASGKVMIK